MNTKNRSRTSVWAACIAAWCGWGAMEAHAQADAWVLTNPAGTAGTWVNTAPNVPLVGPAVALPTPGGPDGYAGQVPTRSHHIRTNGDGAIIFFAVDGNLYNGDGYRIADQRAPNCTVCLAPGAMEFLSVPVPGTCGSYFLFSGVPSSIPVPNAHNAFVQFSVLDMDLPTDPDAPASECTPRMGRILTITEMEQRLPQLQDWLASEFRAWYEPSTSLLPTSDRVLELWMVNFGAKGLAPQIRIVAGEGPDDDSFLFFKTASTLHVYRISANGVIPVQQSLPGTVGDNTYLIPLDDDYDNPGTQTYYFHDSDARRLSNGTIRYAATSNFRFTPFPASTPNGNLISMLFNGTTGVMLPSSNEVFGLEAPLGGVTCPSTADGSPGGIAGCAIAADGQRIFFSMETTPDCVTWTPKFGYFELGPELFTDLNVSLGIPTPYMHGRIYRNRGLSTNGESIYLTGSSTSVGVVNDFNGATPSFSVVNSLSSVAPLFAQPVVSGSNLFQRFLNTSVSGDQHLSSASKAQCCSYFETAAGATVGGHIQLPGMQQTWTAASNPLQPGASSMVLTCDLVVRPGASLTLSGLTLKFAETAKVIVEPGGYLWVQNSTLTSIDCPNSKWAGIRVEGNSSELTQSAQFQGSIYLSNAVVSNARVGLWCARELNITTPVSGFFGGRVLAVNTTFRNCIDGVRISNYHRVVGGSELNYYGNFHQCTFETTTALPDGVPGTHIELGDVNGVLVSNTRFINTAPNNFSIWQRGVGIRSYDAAFRCLGYGNTTSRFEGLTVGVVVTVPDPSEVYRVDGMTFFNNLHGVFDLASTGGVITNNHFTTLASTLPVTSSSVGLSLFNAEGYTVERNTFTDQGTTVPSVGIHFLGQSFQDNEIYDNTFNDLNVGCMVQGRHAAIGGNPSTVPGLQMRCGDHLGNLADQLILPDGWVRHNQGLGQSTQKLANNRFLSAVSCNPGNPNVPSVHTFVAAFQPTGLYVNYHYYDHVDSPEQRQDCVEDEFGNPLSFTGEAFYDLNAHLKDEPFDKAEHCKSGKLDDTDSGDGLGGIQPRYALRQAELANAWANYNGTMDRMRTGDLVGMIDHKPWHPSHLLRDTLLGNYPLTDSVMISMLKREVPLDAWHLTQVLIQNSPLSQWVWSYLDGQAILPIYFLGLLKQFDQGMGLKQVLEQEIVARQQEVQFTKVLLLDSLANDTTLQHRVQVVDDLLDGDVYGDRLRGRYLLALLNGDHGKAGQLALDLAVENGVEGLIDWGSKYMALGGDWRLSTASDLDDLNEMAFTHAPSGGALAWATLYQLAELDSLPTPVLPALFKSLPRMQQEHERLLTMPVITVMPNPAADRIAFTYADGLEEGVLEIHNAQGLLMHSIALNGRKGLVESNVRGWAAGLYVVRLMLDGHTLGSTKFNVVR